MNRVIVLLIGIIVFIVINTECAPSSLRYCTNYVSPESRATPSQDDDDDWDDSSDYNSNSDQSILDENNNTEVNFLI